LIEAINPPQPSFTRAFEHLDQRERDAWLKHIEQQLPLNEQLWVFGYGSLLWRPCFPVAEQLPAVADGYVNRLCIWTIEARGTPRTPGLGLGLERDTRACCHGVIQRVRCRDRAGALSALLEREMLTGIYTPTVISVCTLAQTTQRALAFVVNATHPQYAGRRSLQAQANLVACAHGQLGSNVEYLRETVAALVRVGVDAGELKDVLALIDADAKQFSASTDYPR